MKTRIANLVKWLSNLHFSHGDSGLTPNAVVILTKGSLTRWHQHGSKQKGPAEVTPYQISKYPPSWLPWTPMEDMTAQDVLAANSCPHNWLVPWIHYTHDHRLYELRQEEALLRHGSFWRYFGEDWVNEAAHKVELLDIDLCQNIANIEAYTNTYQDAMTRSMTRALNDLRALRPRSEILFKHMQIEMGRVANMHSLEESRRSLDQGVSTKRLTQLAYLFLPMSLSASIFGMNVFELRNVRLSTFFYTTGVMLFIGLLILYFLGSLYQPMDPQRKVFKLT